MKNFHSLPVWHLVEQKQRHSRKPSPGSLAHCFQHVFLPRVGKQMENTFPDWKMCSVLELVSSPFSRANLGNLFKLFKLSHTTSSHISGPFPSFDCKIYVTNSAFPHRLPPPPKLAPSGSLHPSRVLRSEGQRSRSWPKVPGTTRAAVPRVTLRVSEIPWRPHRPAQRKERKCIASRGCGGSDRDDTRRDRE